MASVVRLSELLYKKHCEVLNSPLVLLSSLVLGITLSSFLSPS